MSKLLITGAFGLVGSNICKVLERDYPHIEIAKVKCDELYVGGEFDYLIFCAGYGQPQKFTQDKLGTILLNTRSLDYFCEKVKQGGTILYVSTSEVYSGAKPPHKETDIGTTTPQHPRACYIEGKRCGEAICMAYSEQGYDVKIARLALAYGPGTKKGDTRVLNQLIEQALVNKKIQLLDAGHASRTYCYVDDVAELMLRILFTGQSTVYNVGGDSTVSIKGLAEMIQEITKCESVTYGTSKGLIDAPPDVKLNMTKTLSEFPLKFTPLMEGLTRTIEYQKQLYGA